MRRLLADPLAWLRSSAAAREAAGLRRRLRPRAAVQELVDLAGNDYLGLARDPRVVDAAVTATRTWGAGSTGSRLVTGSTTLHAELELSLATHAGAESALVFSSGYLANLGAVTALSGRGTLVVSDAYNHASVIDACRLSHARLVVVPHLDVHAVAQALDDRDEERALVVTDGVFSVDGDAAPVAALHAVARRHAALLLVDEAHAWGVVGDRGEGVVAAAGLGGETDVVRTLTLSKALGSQGGAVVGAADVMAHLVDTARTFIFDTGLAPGSAGAALESLRILRTEPGLAARVRRNAAHLATLAAVPAREAAVVAIPIGEPDVAVAAADVCRRHGVLVGCFRPPSVPDGISRLRLTARADLGAEQFDRAAAALQEIRR